MSNRCHSDPDEIGDKIGARIFIFMGGTFLSSQHAGIFQDGILNYIFLPKAKILEVAKQYAVIFCFL